MGLFVALVLILSPRHASALITGAEGNEKLSDTRMPKGAAAIINRLDRIAWWEGEGEFYAEGRGDIEVMNAILTDFAKLDVKIKRIVVHDGIGQSYWINMDKEPDKRKAAQIDWAFMVWPSGKWEWSRKLGRKLLPLDKADLPSQIDVYTANIRWGNVFVPAGIEVIDERLEAHGFTVADGIVIEGHAKDLQNGKPIVASVRVQQIDRKAGKKAGKKEVYATIAESNSDASGRWVLRNLGAGSVRIVLEADGFAPRVVGYARLDDQPQWQAYNSGLARPAPLSGRITDTTGAPLAQVEVSLVDVIVEPGDDYESPTGYRLKTDAEGRFRFDQVPSGKVKVRLHKHGYSMTGLGQPITVPANDIELPMMKAGGPSTP
jgi:hypothetical protein